MLPSVIGPGLPSGTLRCDRLGARHRRLGAGPAFGPVPPAPGQAGKRGAGQQHRAGQPEEQLGRHVVQRDDRDRHCYLRARRYRVRRPGRWGFARLRRGILRCQALSGAAGAGRGQRGAESRKPGGQPGLEGPGRVGDGAAGPATGADPDHGTGLEADALHPDSPAADGAGDRAAEGRWVARRLGGAGRKPPGRQQRQAAERGGGKCTGAEPPAGPALFLPGRAGHARWTEHFDSPESARRNVAVKDGNLQLFDITRFGPVL